MRSYRFSPDSTDYKQRETTAERDCSVQVRLKSRVGNQSDKSMKGGDLNDMTALSGKDTTYSNCIVTLPDDVVSTEF